MNEIEKTFNEWLFGDDKSYNPFLRGLARAFGGGGPYVSNPCPTDFNEEREAAGIEAHERTLEDWAEEHGATCDQEGNWSV
ncbi:MAG: hypothetical protein NT135_02135 [Candidatus Berkelbacteria bacterium]|nr:hypothetical protein [Candidatus Berkelbacteria bacterium]